MDFRKVTETPRFRAFFVYAAAGTRYNERMKRKFRLIDKTSGKIVEEEREVRNEDHFAVQLSHKAVVFRDRKSYNRKAKHKKDPRYDQD